MCAAFKFVFASYMYMYAFVGVLSMVYAIMVLQVADVNVHVHVLECGCLRTYYTGMQATTGVVCVHHCCLLISFEFPCVCCS